jgi:hypothetical protein|tara:strand:+ start:39 stop:158 length:120 start_codon:yes stop_codon:yes gene_type:complete
MEVPLPDLQENLRSELRGCEQSKEQERVPVLRKWKTQLD